MADPNSEKNTEVMPMNFLLPVCVETDDAFFSILKTIINRKSIDENYVDSSLKLGMSGDTFCIHSEDLLMNWSTMTSSKQKIRQFKLLGYWSIQNFSSFGKIVFGKTWKAPQRKNIQVVGPSGSVELQPDEVDEKIARKLSLRILEINLSSSTMAKLKYLVNVPSFVRKNAEQKTGISSKIKPFDVKDEYTEKCWIAFKSGSYLFDANFEQENGSSRTSTQPEIATIQNAIFTQPSDLQEMEDHQINNVDEFEPSEVCKRMRQEVSKDNDRTDYSNDDSSNALEPVGQYKRMRREAIQCKDRADHLVGGSSNDSLKTILLEMQRNIGKITEWLDPEAAVKNNEERLHIMLFKQKDTDIARLKASEQQVMQANQSLTNDASNLKEQVEKQTTIINSLQKGVDATSMLNAKSESDLAASRGIIETMKQEVANKNEENGQLKNQVLELTENLEEAQKKNVEMINADATLKDLLNRWKDYAEKQTTELNAANDKVKNNTGLQVELKEMKSYISGLTREMKLEIEKLEKDLTEVEKEKSQLFDQKQKCQAEVTVLKSQIDELKQRLTNAATTNSQILDENEKLRQEVIVLKGMNVNKNAKAGTQIDTCNETGEKSHKNRGYKFVPNDTVTIDTAAIVELNNEESHSEPMVREIIPNDHQELNLASEIVFPDDTSMQELRDILRTLTFGWMKFHTKNSENYFPAFVRPPDADGKSRAQWVTNTRTISSRKYEFYDFHHTLSDNLKENTEVNALKRFNERFKFSYS